MTQQQIYLGSGWGPTLYPNNPAVYQIPEPLNIMTSAKKRGARMSENTLRASALKLANF